MANKSRIDKYNPVSGGFRAALNAAILTADIGKVQGVSLNASGKVVIGSATPLGYVGIICPVRAMAANEIIDVMQNGEITDFELTSFAAAAAGTPYYLDAAGATSATAPAVGVNATKIGYTVELDRLVVRVQVIQG